MTDAAETSLYLKSKQPDNADDDHDDDDEDFSPDTDELELLRNIRESAF